VGGVRDAQRLESWLRGEKPLKVLMGLEPGAATTTGTPSGVPVQPDWSTMENSTSVACEMRCRIVMIGVTTPGIQKQLP